jgi:predicted XRE-type DNA-binding protein
VSHEDYDEIEHYIEEQLPDPEFEAAYEDARIRSHLLKKLVERRKVRGLSQAQIAARMETTQSAVSDLENGATDPRLSTLQRYSRAIGCVLDICVKDDGGT